MSQECRQKFVPTFRKVRVNAFFFVFFWGGGGMVVGFWPLLLPSDAKLLLAKITLKLYF